MKVFRFWLLCLLLSNWGGAMLSAQNLTQTLRGAVIDQASRQPLQGATVLVRDTEPVLGATTDAQGRFVIEEVPLGRQAIEVRYVGYAILVRSNVVMSSGQETVLELLLTEKVLEGEAVVIESDQRQVVNEAAVVSARSFTVEELRRIPGSIDDPARMAVKFPGISPNSNVLTNELNVRGNPARAVLWRLEGVDIYNPNHFGLLGGSGGSVTLFSQQLLTNTDFFSGAFPADYGNALGGVFDVRFRNGNSQQRAHSVQLGFLGIDLATEGPFSKSGNSSYLVNYRYSTTGLLDQFLELGAIPTFQDLSFKLHFDLPKAATLDVFGIGGLGDISFQPVLDTTQWQDRPGANFGRVTRALTGTIGASYTQPLSEKTFLKTSVVGTGLDQFQVRYYQNKDLVTADTTRRTVDQDYRLTSSTFINHKFGPRHTHRSGLMVHGLFSDVFFVQGNESDAGGGSTGLTDTVRRGAGQSLLVQAYSRSQLALSERWQLNLGLHLMHLAFTGETSLEPRLGLRWQMTPRQSLSVGYGLHSQMEPFFAYITEQRNPAGQLVRPNADLRFNKAHHLVLGYRWRPDEDLRLGVEAYYQRHFNLVVGENVPISRMGGQDFIFETFDLNNGGTAQTYGVELALERSLARGYYFLLNGSLFEATYVANDGAERPSQFNAGLIGNAVGGKEWVLGQKKGRTNLLSLNLSATYSGRQYFTPVDLPASIEAGRFVLDYRQPNTLEQDPLLFVDASLVYQRNRPKYSSQLSLQISNLLNRRPMVGQVFDRNDDEIDTQLGTGIFPILSWRISF